MPFEPIELPIIILRFLLTFLPAFMFGWQRQKAHKPIGFGTFIFVSVGSCALAITALSLSPENPLPLLGAIVTGIGFLGAGALIKTADKIFGFTTAASIWVFAIFGLLMGVGEYIVAFILYALIWAVIIVDRNMEKKGVGSYQRKVTIHTNALVNLREVASLLGSRNYKVLDFEIDKKTKSITVVYLVEGSKEDINHIPENLLKKEWADSFKIE
ncbi:MgtC/SapB family protein [Candidatus Woesearchaeota archaeon]|nr:MgtC/SapB family protein [Candidatus Woesearchaeota archaeon]